MTIDEITQYITDHGCWNREGYGTQQRQAELAQLVHYLLPNADRYRRFLEIGSAAGGTARILDDFLKFDSIHIVDDNSLGLQDLRKENLPNAVEWIGDSTTVDCQVALGIWGVEFDLVHIDAGHSYECVSQDTVTATMFASPGAIIFLHDVVCSPIEDNGIARWVEELQGSVSPLLSLRYITTFGDDLGIGVFQWM